MPLHLKHVKLYEYIMCEGRIEKSIPMITDWYHEACRVMTNGDIERQNFLSYPHTNNRFFSCQLLNNFFYNGKTCKGLLENPKYKEM